MTPLHLLCAPFPSPQGTQAAVAAMLRAERDGGLPARLLAYAEAYGEVQAGVRVDRLPAIPIPVGARSGPSFARVAHDVGAVLALIARPAGELVLAHNVEAGIACAMAGVPYVYVAHTSMRHELPTYDALGRHAARFGDCLDRLAASRALAIAAIVPDLRDELAHRLGREVALLPVPWEAAQAAAERAESRARLGLAEGTLAILHAGNLDAYQGLDTMLEVVRELSRTRTTTLLVATESNAEGFRRQLVGEEIEHRLLPLASEDDRRIAHAAADVALVVRTVPFGLPIKLLEALSRGVPLVTTRLASGGLPLVDSARVLPEANIAGLARACIEAVDAPREQGTRAGHAYLRAHHAASSFRIAEQTIVDRVRARMRRSSR